LAGHDVLAIEGALDMAQFSISGIDKRAGGGAHASIKGTHDCSITAGRKMKSSTVRATPKAGSLFAATAGAFLLTASGVATAGCGLYVPSGNAPVGFTVSPTSVAAQMTPAVYSPSQAAGQFLRVSDSDDWGNSGLVGMWNVTFTSDGTAYPAAIPYGVVFDFGTIQYHSDGTEFEISGGRAPSTGDVCMGIWRQTGERTYQVKHIGLSWLSSDSTPPSPTAKFLGPGKFAETIQLNRKGDRFTGTIIIDQYAADGVTLLEHISGTMAGVRFTFD